MITKKLIFISIMSVLLSSCITQNTVPVNTAYSFEKRYDRSDKIIVNGEEITVPKGKSIWILTSDTLNNLLIYAGGERIEQ